MHRALAQMGNTPLDNEAEGRREWPLKQYDSTSRSYIVAGEARYFMKLVSCSLKNL